MKKIVRLSQENPELARQEVLELTLNNDYEQIKDLLIIDDKLNIELYKRLGLSHATYKLLFTTNIQDINKKIKDFDWEKIYKDNFCVRLHGDSKKKEREFSTIIYNKISAPIVNLKNPVTKIEFFKREEKMVCGLLIKEIDKSFLKRKAHMRPRLHPTSLHPGLARACINLTGLKKGKILDPFCGSAGLLIEAGIMGFDITGYDLDYEQTVRAKINLNHYKIKKFEIIEKDALEINEKTDAIVTDLPYGKGSKATNIEKLYINFLKKSYEYTDNMIIIFPDFVKHKNILKQTEWKIKNNFVIYVHKSLSRIIYKLTK